MCGFQGVWCGGKNKLKLIGKRLGLKEKEAVSLHPQLEQRF